MTLSDQDMASAIAAALAIVLTRAGGAMIFDARELKFSGTIHINSDGDNIKFIVVNTESRN